MKRFVTDGEYPRIQKDPDAVMDYIINWSNWLRSDTISTSSWTVDDGITKDSDSNTTTTATIWLSGGTEVREYKVVNEIITAGGRTKQQTLVVRIRDK